MLNTEHLLLGLPKQLNLESTQDEKFLALLMSKESSISMGRGRGSPCSSSSSRVSTYYGGLSAGVPFLWESKPGTPKHSFSSSSHDSHLPPPLNPPPCYNRNALLNPIKFETRSKSFVFRNLFPRMKRSHAPEVLSPSSSSSSSSSPSSPLSPLRIFRRSQSTSIRHKSSMFDYDLYEEKKTCSRRRACFF